MYTLDCEYVWVGCEPVVDQRAECLAGLPRPSPALPSDEGKERMLRQQAADGCCVLCALSLSLRTLLSEMEATFLSTRLAPLLAHSTDKVFLELFLVEG